MKKDAILIIIAFASVIFLISYSNAGSVDLSASSVYYANINGSQQTLIWGAIIGSLSSESYEFTTFAMDRVGVTSSSIYVDDVPGENLARSKYNILSMRKNISFNVNNVSNTSSSDLMPGILFSSRMFNGVDAPNTTFTCGVLQEYNISGTAFKGCYTSISQNSKMGLLKYCTDSCEPLFIVDLKDTGYSCYNSSYCDYQFIVPINLTHPYYFYFVSKLPEYNVTAWIDRVESWTFAQTARPYRVDLRVTNIYTGAPVSNVSIAMAEEQGNNLFIPLRTTSFISRARSVGLTDSDGNISYIIAPTEYPEDDSYSMMAVTLQDDDVTKFFNFSIENSLSIEFAKKNITPTPLSDNAKVSVNAMNQIVNSLYIWANTLVSAKTTSVVVYTNGSFSPTNISIQTGAPNLLTFYVRNSDGTPNAGTVKVLQTDGYLIMSPTYNATNISVNQHRHFITVDSGTSFVITPTSYGIARSKASFQVFDDLGSEITEINASINPNLEPRSGSFYNNDDLKVIINAMASVISSLYFALN